MPRTNGTGLADILLSVLGIVAALLFMMHGTQKLFGFPNGALHLPARLLTQFGLAGMLETFGGACLLIGLFTRPVAFVLSGEMAVAYFQAHLPRGFWPLGNGGEPAVLFCFLWLYISVAGPGPFSVDGLMRGRARRR